MLSEEGVILYFDMYFSKKFPQNTRLSSFYVEDILFFKLKIRGRRVHVPLICIHSGIGTLGYTTRLLSLSCSQLWVSFVSCFRLFDRAAGLNVMDWRICSPANYQLSVSHKTAGRRNSMQSAQQTILVINELTLRGCQ